MIRLVSVRDRHRITIGSGLILWFAKFYLGVTSVVLQNADIRPIPSCNVSFGFDAEKYKYSYSSVPALCFGNVCDSVLCYLILIILTLFFFCL